MVGRVGYDELWGEDGWCPNFYLTRDEHRHAPELGLCRANARFVPECTRDQLCSVV